MAPDRPEPPETSKNFVDPTLANGDNEVVDAGGGLGVFFLGLSGDLAGPVLGLSGFGQELNLRIEGATA